MGKDKESSLSVKQKQQKVPFQTLLLSVLE